MVSPRACLAVAVRGIQARIVTIPRSRSESFFIYSFLPYPARSRLSQRRVRTRRWPEETLKSLGAWRRGLQLSRPRRRLLSEVLAY